MDLNRIATGDAWLEMYFNHAMFRLAQAPDGETVRLVCPPNMAPAGPPRRARRALEPFDLRSPPNVDTIPQRDGTVQRVESDRPRDQNGEYARWLQHHGLPSYFLSHQHLAILRDLGPNPNVIEWWAAHYDLADGIVARLPIRQENEPSRPQIQPQEPQEDGNAGPPLPIQPEVPLWNAINRVPEPNPSPPRRLRLTHAADIIPIPHIMSPETQAILDQQVDQQNDRRGLLGVTMPSSHGEQRIVQIRARPNGRGIDPQGPPNDSIQPRQPSAPSSRGVEAPRRPAIGRGGPPRPSIIAYLAANPRMQQVHFDNGGSGWVDRANAEVDQPDPSKFCLLNKSGGINEWPHAQSMDWSSKDMVSKLNRWRQQTISRHWLPGSTRAPRNPYSPEEIAFMRNFVRREASAGTFNVARLTGRMNAEFGAMYRANEKELRTQNGVEYWLRRDRECCRILNWALTRR